MLFSNEPYVLQRPAFGDFNGGTFTVYIKEKRSSFCRQNTGITFLWFTSFSEKHSVT